MDLSEILAISGKPGLYRMVAQNKGGLIVEAIEDDKRFPVYSTHQISALEEISIYTYEEDVPLKEVFEKMFNVLEGKVAMSPKSNKNDMMAFFETVLPDFNQEQVYASDVKKIIQWYNIFHKHGMLSFDDKEDEVVETKDEDDKKESTDE
ncbi:MAG: DUF5606 domain-containing protein [Bacteroidales bacterium]|nr:DUF5606 domain-containing protein [Bacteroidales bacterium]